MRGRSHWRLRIWLSLRKPQFVAAELSSASSRKKLSTQGGRALQAPGSDASSLLAFRASRAAESELSSDEDAAADGKVAVWYGLVKGLFMVRLKDGGEGEGGGARRSQRLVAVVEWEGSLKVDSVASLPYSARKRGRVWRGGSVSAISIELVDRLIGYLEVEQGSMIARQYIDPDHGHLDLANPNSKYQL